MDDVSHSDINEMLKHTDLQGLCSPFSGNCFEVALALHTVIKIQGDLFDAGGKLYKSQLLEEFAPVQNQKLVEFEETFQYNHVVSDKFVQKIIFAYENRENV